MQSTAADIGPSKLKGYEFYKTALKSAKHVVAPMVDGSELPWRILSRRYGAELCYTPMFHARLFAEQAKYRTEQWSTNKEDRPLIVQFCANDPASLLAAAKLVEDDCDGVDLNLGCPQHIAKRGHYGSFLMEEWDLVESMVKNLHENLKVPVTCKIRVYPDEEHTIKYAKMLENAGCQLLTVHGRFREQKGHKTGLADWKIIKKIKKEVSIPVFANGNILHQQDIQRCMEATEVDGIMTAEGNLYNPALFTGKHPFVWDMAKEYLEICADLDYKHAGIIRGHLFKILRPCLSYHPDIRAKLPETNEVADFLALVSELETRLRATRAEDPAQDLPMPMNPEDLDTAVYDPAYGGIYYKYPHWICQPNVRTETGMAKTIATAAANDLPVQDEEAAQRREIVGQKRLARKMAKQEAKRARTDLCSRCDNVLSKNCSNKACKVCCRAIFENGTCELHKRSGAVKISTPAVPDTAITSAEPEREAEQQDAVVGADEKRLPS